MPVAHAMGTRRTRSTDCHFQRQIAIKAGNRRNGAHPPNDKVGNHRGGRRTLWSGKDFQEANGIVGQSSNDEGFGSELQGMRRVLVQWCLLVPNK
jgi:hypothetical protein